ncbi:MAG TPA: alpha/beta fold hydrolase [Opitutaceae bacterium]|nr:alpha/beta fold hydrolase [Opitutaceae bacterium]
MKNKLIALLGILGSAATTGTFAAALPQDTAAITVHHETREIAGVPADIFWADEPQLHPLLLLSHGFSGDKAWIAGQFDADALARRGWMVVCIDNRMHGARPGPHFSHDEIQKTGKVDLLELRQAMHETANDVSRMIDVLVRDPRVDAGRIGMSGISMGGFVTFAATARDPRIKAAAPLIASPYWDDVPRGTPFQFLNVEAAFALAAESDPARHPERFAPRGLFVQIGEDDPHFDTAKVHAFCDKLAADYRDQPDRFAFRAYPGVGHDATPEMRASAVAWLERQFGFSNGTITHPAANARSTVREDEFTVAAAPERVFPLLCPVLEYDWLPGWECDVLNTASGVAEDECIFRTVRKDSGTMTWVVTRYEPPHLIEFTCFNTTTEHVMRMSIRLDATTDGGTRLHWRRRWIATGPAGGDLVEHFDHKSQSEIIHAIERFIVHHLHTGEKVRD